MIGKKSYFNYLFVVVLGVIFIGGCGTGQSPSTILEEKECNEIDLKDKSTKINDWNTVYSEYKQLDKSIDEYIRDIEEKGVKNVNFQTTKEVCQSLKIITTTQIPTGTESESSKIINFHGNSLKKIIYQAADRLDEDEINKQKKDIKDYITKDGFGAEDVNEISNFLQYKLFELELEIKKAIPDDQKLNLYKIERDNKEANSKNSDKNGNEQPGKPNNPPILLPLFGILLIGVGGVLFWKNKPKNSLINRNETFMNSQRAQQNTISEPDTISQLETIIREQLSKVDQLVTDKIEESRKIYIKEIQSLKVEISELKDKLVKLEQKDIYSPTTSHGESHESKSKTPDSPATPNNPETPTSAPSNTTRENEVIIEDSRFANLSSKIEVIETKESVENRRIGHNQAPILKQVGKNQGNYMVVNLEGIDYLVPNKRNFKINEYNLNTVQLLFECRNYRDDYSTFTCIQGAKVSRLGDNWQLKEKGILEFE